MPTLLLQIKAPMVSWGDSSRFTSRHTRLEPTKSAVIGLLCAALGRPRSESVADLARLRMGVRVDSEGVLHCDFHTVIGAIKSSGAKGDTSVSYRYYLSDAHFFVALEGEDCSFLEQLDLALQRPVSTLR